MTPLVTIGITVFNAQDSVGRAVASALAQDWGAFEIVIVDDASTDGSWAAIGALTEKDPQILAFRQDSNGGVAAARNRIVAAARGAFIAFFDDDDESTPERISRQVGRMLDYERDFAEGAPVICHTARQQIMLDGSSRIEPTMGQPEGVLAPHGPEVARSTLAGTPIKDGHGAQATCSQMARTETYRALGGFDAAFRRVEDTDFCVRAALAGAHFVGIAEPLVTQTLTRSSDKSLAGELHYKLKLIDKHRAVFDSPRQYRHSREWMITRHHWLARRRLRFTLRMGIAAVTHPVLTWQRLHHALPNLAGNRAFATFHGTAEGP